MQLVRESLYDDTYYINVLNEALLNEDFNIDKLKNAISRIKDKASLLNNFIKKFNNEKNFSAKKHLASILVILFLMNFTGRNSVLGDITHARDVIAKENKVNLKKLDVATKKLQFINFDYKTAKVSEAIKIFIKKYEKLSLTAYSLNDKKITIGYGHTYPETKSPYKVGDKISLAKAESYFEKDILYAQEGVKRLLKRWDEQGIKVEIDQNMFDAMISIVYNIGLTRFLESDFVQLLKKNKYDQAAEKIKTTALNPKFPGLITRRQEEAELFSKNI